MKRSFLALSLTAVLISVIILAIKQGGEFQFSPYTFETRGVSFRFLRFTEIVLFTSYNTPKKTKLGQFLEEAGYLQIENDAKPRWDTVTGWTERNYSGPAKPFLYPVGRFSEEGADEWIQWSKQNPEFARRMWPVVVKGVRRGGYYYRPTADLMLSAKKSN